MIRVWVSNRLERLAGRLLRALESDEGGSGAGLFARPQVVVPNEQIATYLKYEVARTAGIAAGLALPVLEQFHQWLLEEHVPDASPPYRLVSQATLRTLFLGTLSDSAMDQDQEPLLEPVRAYLNAADDASSRDLRRFQLATRLARLARQYGDTCPELLRAWAAGATSLGDDDGPLAETEGWQRVLWARVIGPGGPLDRARAEGRWHWVLPTSLFRVLERAAGYEPPEVVHIFGFSYLWTGLRELLEHLGRTAEVHVYVLSPWRWSAVPPADPQNALLAWGRPGVDFMKLVAGLNAGVERHFVASAPGRALGRLQNEILEGTGSGPHGSPYRRDDSIQVLACASIRREAEAIAGEIWRLIREDDAASSSDNGDPAAGRLRFSDFAVLIADTENRTAYQAHLRAAFEELYAIPHNMIDLPMAGECRVVEAVLLLLKLPLGTFTRPELLPLLVHPAVRTRFPGAETSRWRAWCEQLAIVHGADRSDHKDTYIDRDAFHWEQGLRRLVLGTFLTGPRCGSEQGFLLDGADLLPHDEPVEAQADAARLLVLVRALVADARYARDTRLTLSAWSEFLARIIGAYLAADPDADSERHALADCLASVAALKKYDIGDTPVGYRVAYEILREAIGGMATARGHYLADGVAIAPLLAMRALPFRVVFVAGLGEGRFPAPDGPDPLDLGRAPRWSGNVSPRQRDQYLFLETIACTRERLYLSYVSRDPQTGEGLEPSSVVRELLRRLAGSRAAEPGASRWVRNEPLRRYAGLESGNAPIPSAAARRESKARELRSQFREHCGHEPEMTPERVWGLDQSLRRWLRIGPAHEPAASAGTGARQTLPREVSLRQVRQFLECPLQGWARLALRLAEDAEDDEAVREDEPFATDRLSETVLLRDVFLDALTAGRLDGEGEIDWPAFESFYSVRAEALARAGAMPVGLFRTIELRRHGDRLANWAAAWRQRALAPRGPYSVRRFGRAAENERADDLGPPLRFDILLPAADGADRSVRVHLFGRTGIVSRNLPGSLACVNRAAAGPRDFLAGFLDALVLSLIDDADVDEFQVHILDGSGPGGKPDANVRRLRGIDRRRAREYLAGVLAEMLGQRHAYLLPCEAVFAYLSRKQTPIAQSIEEMMENDRVACSSRRGPVPDFTLFEPPGEDEALAMIERRFGLFRDCGGLGE
jgi:exodeoxyribonuclease V gamma subunit